MGWQPRSVSAPPVDHLADRQRVAVSESRQRDRQLHPGRVGRGHDLLGLGDRRGEHLLGEDVLAGLGRLHHQVAMLVRGGGDGDAVEVVARQQPVEIAGVLHAELVRAREELASGGIQHALGVVVPDGDQFRPGMLLSLPRVVPRVHVPESQGRDLQRFRHLGPPQSETFRPTDGQQYNVVNACKEGSARRCQTALIVIEESIINGLSPRLPRGPR